MFLLYYNKYRIFYNKIINIVIIIYILNNISKLFANFIVVRTQCGTRGYMGSLVEVWSVSGGKSSVLQK